MRTACLALLALSACASSAVTAAPSASSGGGERTVLARANEARQRAGCPALTWSETAAAVAEAHSADMARSGYFSHVSRNGAGPGDRLRAAGIAWSRVAENIALTASAEDAMRLWMGSAGHRENLLNCAYTHTGVGEVSGRWTQVFYTPAR